MLSYFTPILMYHKLDEDAQHSKLSVSSASFLKQMIFISKKKFTVLRVKDLNAKNLKNKKQITITFDDGFLCCYTEALPILEDLNVKATFYVIFDRIGEDGYLTTSQIREMHSLGHEIASHTLSHAWLPDLKEEALQQEIVESKKKLEDLMGESVNTFAYPKGGLNRQVLDMVKEAGYHSACATNPPVGFCGSDLFSLRRIKVSHTSDKPLNFKLKVSGYYHQVVGKR